MERDRARLLVRDQQGEPQWSWPPRTTGFVASWRPINVNKPAIKVGGSPFDTFAEAEKACEAFLSHLTS